MTGAGVIILFLRKAGTNLWPLKMARMMQLPDGSCQMARKMQLPDGSSCHYLVPAESWK